MPAIGVLRGGTRHPDGLGSFDYAWLEAPLATRLARTADVPDWSELDCWPEGRLFDARGEYRWRFADGQLHGVFLLDDEPLPDGCDHRLNLERLEDTTHLLFGEWVDPEADRASNPDGGPWFYAPEIPRAQRYPVELGEAPHAGKVARLLVRRYRDEAGLAGEFLRCTGFDLIVERERHG